MAKLATDQTFCDMHVALDDGSLIPCHRIVLAAASEFFMLALSDPMANKEDGARLILPKTEARVFTKLAKFVYTGVVSIADLNELDEVLALAHFAMFAEVIRACEVCYVEFIRSMHRHDKSAALVVNRMIFADGFGLAKLRAVCIDEVYQHIGAISRDWELVHSFVTGLSVDGVVEFLSGDGLHGGERVVFDFAKGWLEAHPASDETVRAKVLETVRFCYLAHSDALELAEQGPLILKLMCRSYVDHLSDAPTPRGGIAADDYVNLVRRGDKLMITNNAVFLASETRKYGPCAVHLPVVKRLAGVQVVVADYPSSNGVSQMPVVTVDGVERTPFIRVVAGAEELTHVPVYVPISCIHGRG